MRPRPFALEPLARAAGISLGLVGARGFDGEPAGLVALAERLGTTPRWLRSLRTAGLTWDLADRYSVALGYHPAELWPDWWREAEADERRGREVAA